MVMRKQLQWRGKHNAKKIKRCDRHYFWVQHYWFSRAARSVALKGAQFRAFYKWLLTKYGDLLSCLQQDIYWIGFVWDFSLYSHQTSQQGTILIPGLVAQKPSRTRTSRPIFSVRVISYHFSGHLVPSFIMGFNSLMLFFYVSKFTFQIGYYTSNWLLTECILVNFIIEVVTLCCVDFNSVNPLCLFVCMYIHE